jgi:hypothetical protein
VRSLFQRHQVASLTPHSQAHCFADADAPGGVTGFLGLTVESAVGSAMPARATGDEAVFTNVVLEVTTLALPEMRGREERANGPLALAQGPQLNHFPNHSGIRAGSHHAG